MEEGQRGKSKSEIKKNLEKNEETKLKQIK
jgi:hypothetical protein